MHHSLHIPLDCCWKRSVNMMFCMWISLLYSLQSWVGCSTQTHHNSLRSVISLLMYADSTVYSTYTGELQHISDLQQNSSIHGWYIVIARKITGKNCWQLFTYIDVCSCFLRLGWDLLHDVQTVWYTLQVHSCLSWWATLVSSSFI